MNNHIKLLFSFLIIAVFSFSSSHAQVEQIVLFDGKFDEELLTLVQDNYTPAVVYDYSQARDIMYSVIDNYNDTVTCVYTGYSVYVDPSLDPSSAAGAMGINTEHVYPRSKGAKEGNGKSDMHHLMPSLDYVNSRRSNNPFRDINDSETQYWYRLKRTMTGIPSSDKDEYSEATFNYFEPREDIKGNIARAVFYFYSIYQDEAEAADENFFPFMRKTLYHWHKIDPVDQEEYDRTMLIKLYQDNKPNPYVLDSTLATRLFCEGTMYDCTVTTDIEETYSEIKSTLYQSHFGNSELLLQSDIQGEWNISIIDLQGRIIKTMEENAIVGKMSVVLEGYNINSGVYFIRVIFNDSNHRALKVQTHKFIK